MKTEKELKQKRKYWIFLILESIAIYLSIVIFSYSINNKQIWVTYFSTFILFILGQFFMKTINKLDKLKSKI